MGSSPNRSIDGCCRRTAGWFGEVTRCEADRSIFTCCCTTARGWYVSYLCSFSMCRYRQTLTTSSPSSRVEGSGIPPSMTHRLESYLVRMKFSIFLKTLRVSTPSKDGAASFVHLRFRRNMARRQLRFPIPVTWVSTWSLQHESQLLMTNLFALELPHFNTLCNCSSVHASRSTDLTRLMCVPMPR